MNHTIYYHETISRNSTWNPKHSIYSQPEIDRFVELLIHNGWVVIFELTNDADLYHIYETPISVYPYAWHIKGFIYQSYTNGFLTSSGLNTEISNG